jgi:hypothetical protein
MEAAKPDLARPLARRESATTRRIDREPETDLTWSCFIRPHLRYRHTRHHDRGGGLADAAQISARWWPLIRRNLRRAARL